MPLYAYTCDACSAEFELLVRSSETPACPACAAETLTRQVSRVSAEIRHKAVAKAGRRAAAAAGHLSNFSRAERKS